MKTKLIKFMSLVSLLASFNSYGAGQTDSAALAAKAKPATKAPVKNCLNVGSFFSPVKVCVGDEISNWYRDYDVGLDDASVLHAPNFSRHYFEYLGKQSNDTSFVVTKLYPNTRTILISGTRGQLLINARELVTRLRVDQEEFRSPGLRIKTCQNPLKDFCEDSRIVLKASLENGTDERDVEGTIIKLWANGIALVKAHWIDPSKKSNQIILQTVILSDQMQVLGVKVQTKQCLPDTWKFPVHKIKGLCVGESVINNDNQIFVITRIFSDRDLVVTDKAGVEIHLDSANIRRLE